MKLDDITPLILTYNEEANILRTLNKLCWAKSIIVVDSGSTDETAKILKTFSNVQLFIRKFNTHAEQWNYGISCVETEWVLSLDADYRLSDDLVFEIINLKLSASKDGYFVGFKYCINGTPLHRSLLPPRQVLFKKRKAIYIDDGHTQLLVNHGRAGKLQSVIYHDDRKSFKRWLENQNCYSNLETEKITKTSYSRLNWPDRLRKFSLVLSPGLVFFYTLFFKGCAFDGWAGWYYSFQRLLSEVILSIKLMEYQISKFDTPR
jgi:glycosyltransferase involved in cell wall biosynthesis